MGNKWMVRNLRDDHVRESDEYRPKYRDSFIGVLCYPGRLPVTVSCGPVDYNNHLCLNKVYTDADGAHHLSTVSECSINGEELRQLKKDGKLLLTRTMGDPTVYLLPEVEEVKQSEQDEDNELRNAYGGR